MKRLKRDEHTTALIPQDSSPSNVETSKHKQGDDKFRQFFEASFGPLADSTPRSLQQTESSASEHEDDACSTGTDWDGLSDSESSNAVEIVDYAESLASRRGTLKSPGRSGSSELNADKTDDDRLEDKAETLNLKNDLALQRLLKESQLLGHSGGQNPRGSKRHRTTDLRLQALGSKESILNQEKMPMSHRKGMQAKAAAREAARREEAKVNGIILEREKPRKSRLVSKRERTVGNPGVGKFSGGTLTLSDRDVRRIQGGKRVGTAKKGARR